jgi:hypothetical protein
MQIACPILTNTKEPQKMATVKLESLAWASCRMHGLSEEEEAGTFVLYVVQNIYISGEKRMHPIVRVSIKGNGNRRKAKTRFRKECDRAIHYMMECRAMGRTGGFDLEWERPSDQQRVEQYVKDFIPKAKGEAATRLRQMWLKATPEGMFFIGAICGKNQIDYEQLSNTLVVAQGDAKQMAVLSQHMRSEIGFNKGVTIMKEVEIEHCVDSNGLKELISFLGAEKEYRAMMVGRWAMIQDKKTRRVSPIFGGDHFGSLEWMDNMLTAKKAQTAMTVAVADVDIIALDMAPVYESFYGMCAAPLAPVTKRSA